MADLYHLVNSLKAKYIIVIENDLHYETDPKIALVKFCGLSEFKRIRFTVSLQGIDRQDLIDIFETFKAGFEQLEHNEVHRENLLPDDLAQYLNEVGGNDLLNENILLTLNEALEVTVVLEILLRNGIFKMIDERYNVILDEFCRVPGVEITYYRSRPVPAEANEFTGELKYGIENTGSVYYIAVVDKMLGEGNEESGKAFIEQDLLLINNTNNFKSLAFLFTSQANVSHPMDYDSYFIREVDKETPNLIEVVAAYLTDTSYATVFKSFHDDYFDSAIKSLTIALRNQQNVKHVISKSISEGISPFDSLKAWFDQIVQFNIEKRHIESIGYYSALTNYFDSQSLTDHEGLKEYGPEMEKLNSYELFDHNINKKGLPIYPGDIFKKDNDYYILIGQVCDLLIRSATGTRGAKIAEFLKIKVKPFPDEDEEKFKVSVDDKGKKDIKIQHFYDIATKSYNVAEIEITSKNLYYGEFNVLDLCFYNDNGISELSIVDLEQYKNYHWVTEEKYKQLEVLSAYFQENLQKLKDSRELNDFNTNIFSAFGVIEEENKLKFCFERVSRLKGRFYDSLYQQVNNYKARIDLNLIDQAIDTTSNIRLAVKYKFLDEEQQIDAPLIKLKGEKKIIKVKDIYELVDPFYQPAMVATDKFIEGNVQNEYSLTIDESENSLSKLELLVQYNDKGNKSKAADGPNVRFARLFNEQLENRAYELIDNQEQAELNDEGEISLGLIKRGIKLLQNNTVLTISNGRIQKTTP